MSNSRGRKDKYVTHVKERFDEIKKWLESGATEKEIYKNLGICKDTWIRYKDKHSELSDLIKNSRKQPVEEIKAAMLKRATGFQYEEIKVVRESIEFESGDEIIPARKVRTEITTKTALPDVAAGLVLLKHWDKNEKGQSNWSSDPATLELKKEELELKRKKLEDEEW